jgi:hypothetical protein
MVTVDDKKITEEASQEAEEEVEPTRWYVMRVSRRPTG